MLSVKDYSYYLTLIRMKRDNCFNQNIVIWKGNIDGMLLPVYFIRKEFNKEILFVSFAKTIQFKPFYKYVQLIIPTPLLLQIIAKRLWLLDKNRILKIKI